MSKESEKKEKLEDEKLKYANGGKGIYPPKMDEKTFKFLAYAAPHIKSLEEFKKEHEKKKKKKSDNSDDN